jgi:RNA polymerase sigma-70 factor (ECF subfamily)
MGTSSDALESSREDATWIATILSGSPAEAQEECYANLLKKYWKLIVVLASSRTGDRRAAEDIAQEAFIRAFRSLRKLEEPVAFLGWLLRIARNLITDHLRSRPPRMETIDAAGDVAGHWARPEAPDFQQKVEEAEEVELVLSAMKEIPEKYREVVALRYLQGLDGKTMARLLGEPEGTIRNRLFRALEKIRGNLERKRLHEP